MLVKKLVSRVEVVQLAGLAAGVEFENRRGLTHGHHPEP
jgi:hypothetical protein